VKILLKKSQRFQQGLFDKNIAINSQVIKVCLLRQSILINFIYRQRSMHSVDDQRGEPRFSPLETPSGLCPQQAAEN